MDNRHVDVLSAGKEHLQWALGLLSNGRALTHYLEENGQLVLCWAVPRDSAIVFTPLLFSMWEPDEMAAFVWGWLERKAVAQHSYDSQSDVKNQKGAFRAWCGPWGKDERYEYGFARIEARYAWIGK